MLFYHNLKKTEDDYAGLARYDYQPIDYAGLENKP